MSCGEAVWSKFQEFEPYVLTIVRSHTIPGKLVEEDLVSEALILIYELSEAYDEIDIASERFDRLFKRSLVNHIRGRVAEAKRHRRDVRRETAYYREDNMPAADPDPVVEAEFRETKRQVSSLLEGDARVLWKLLSGDLPSRLIGAVADAQERLYQHRPYLPHSNSRAVLAEALGWYHDDPNHSYRIRRALGEIRDAVVEVMGMTKVTDTLNLPLVRDYYGCWRAA